MGRVVYLSESGNTNVKDIISFGLIHSLRYVVDAGYGCCIQTWKLTIMTQQQNKDYEKLDWMCEILVVQLAALTSLSSSIMLITFRKKLSSFYFSFLRFRASYNDKQEHQHDAANKYIFHL
jgi:hypothetical protein